MAEAKNIKAAPKVKSTKVTKAENKAETKAVAPKKTLKSVESKQVKLPTEVKAVKTATKQYSGKTVTIKQIASGAGRKKNQIQTLTGLGLGKLHRQVELQDNQSIRGMIKTVSHLIKIVNE